MDMHVLRRQIIASLADDPFHCISHDGAHWFQHGTLAIITIYATCSTTSIYSALTTQYDLRSSIYDQCPAPILQQPSSSYLSSRPTIVVNYDRIELHYVSLTLPPLGHQPGQKTSSATA
eukprot:2332110-Amphidinium_carterae.1